MTTMGNPFLQNSDWMQAGQNLMGLATNAAGRGRGGSGANNPSNLMHAQLQAQQYVENERRDRMLGEAQGQAASVYNFKDPSTNQPVAVNPNDPGQQAEVRRRVTDLIAQTIPFANQQHVRENLALALAGISSLNQDERSARAMQVGAGRTPSATDFATTDAQSGYNEAQRQMHYRITGMQQAGENSRAAARLAQENRNISPDQVVGSIYRRVAQGGPGVSPAEQAIIDQHSGPIVVDGVAYSRPSVRLPTIDEQPGGGQPSRFTGRTVTQQVFGQPGGMQQLTPTPQTLPRVQGGIAADIVAGRDVSPEARSLVPDSTRAPTVVGRGAVALDRQGNVVGRGDPMPVTPDQVRGSIMDDLANNRPVSPERRALLPPETLAQIQGGIAARISRNDPTVTQAERDLVPTHAPPDYNMAPGTQRFSGRTGDLIATGQAPSARGRPPALHEAQRNEILRQMRSNTFGSAGNAEDMEAALRQMPAAGRQEVADAMAWSYANSNNTETAAREAGAVFNRYMEEQRGYTGVPFYNGITGFTPRATPLPAPDSAAAPFTPGNIAKPASQRVVQTPAAAAPARGAPAPAAPAAAAPQTPAAQGAAAAGPLPDDRWRAALRAFEADLARASTAPEQEAVRRRYQQMLIPRAGGRPIPPALAGQSG